MVILYYLKMRKRPEVVEEDRRRVCSPDYLRLLKKLGYKTDGDEDSLEAIIRGKGYNLPGYLQQDNSDVYFGFVIDGHVFMHFNYADSLAEEIIELHNFNLL